jgi:hypothetical protein
MTIKTGDTVTVKMPEHAYGYEPVFLNPGETAIVINPKAPAVRGNRPYFAYCEFDKAGQHERAGIFPDNLILLRKGLKP